MRVFLRGLAATSAAILLATPCVAAPATETARQKLHGAAAAMDAAWDRKDLTAWAALFDQDATIQAGPTAVVEGRAAIRAFFGR